ncbi:transposable element Tcb1 transposase [Trichonephila clavipes]|nr:transposable element Tcb1 transposase [Trichonephila clavipes]
MNPCSLYSIKIVASVFFGGIVVNAGSEHSSSSYWPITLRDAIGYTSRSPLVGIDDTLNSARCISGVLRPGALPFFRVLRNPTFQQDNERPLVAGIVQTLLDTENVWLLPCLYGIWLPSDWLNTIRQALRLMSWGITLKLHGHLYLYIPSNLCSTQYPGVYV